MGKAKARAYPYGEHYSYDCYRNRDKKLNEKTYIWRYKDGDGDGLAWLGVVALLQATPYRLGYLLDVRQLTDNSKEKKVLHLRQ